MFKFEKASENKESKNDNNEGGNLFRKIRENSNINKGLQVLAVSSIGAGLGKELGEESVKIAGNIKENKTESSRAIEYDLTKYPLFTNDTIKYLSDDFIAEIVIKEGNYYTEDLLSQKKMIIELINNWKEKLNNEDYINILIKSNNDNGVKIENIDSYKNDINKEIQRHIYMNLKKH
jgi:hypothetical protein